MITIKQTIERYYKIRPKSGDIQNLKYNTAQNKVYEIFKREYNAEKPVRLIILKARQLGISTFAESLLTELTTTHFNKNALIVAHDSDSTSAIYAMTKLFFEELPPEIQPMVKYSNARILTFENPTMDSKEKALNPGLRSSIRVSTAGASGIARGSTIHYCHLSELAFWDSNAMNELTGIFQAIPATKETLVIIESTANGYNAFKQLWDDAVSGRSDYIPIFIPWYEMEEYRMPYDGKPLTKEETELKDQYKLDNDQIQWRRYKIRNDCHNDISAFRQEYPSNPDEAFIMSGNPIFNGEDILRCLEHPFLGRYVGIFTYQNGSDKPTNYRLRYDPNGPLTIYHRPVSGRAYCIGCDTSGDGSDYFVGFVIDCKTGNIVAKYRNQTDEALFTRQIYCLGKYYNDALLAIETNFSSYPTMKLQEYGYLNMYVREVNDTYQEKYQHKFGFRTTAMTRPIIISNLQDLARDSIDSMKDEDLLREMLSFVKDETGKPQAATGMHDDCVMAAAIGYYCMPQAGTFAETTSKVEDSEETYLLGDSSVESFLKFGE